MRLKLATLLFAASVAVTPVGVAAKFLLGATGTTWIDPTLVLSLGAMAMLLPDWEDFLEEELRPLTIGAAVLFIASFCSALSGAVLRPPTSLYTVLREP